MISGELQETYRGVSRRFCEFQGVFEGFQGLRKY